MNKTAQNIIITLCGATTCILTLATLTFVELETGVAYYAQPFFEISLLYPILTGLVASSGYYLGAKYFSIRPSKRILLYMFLLSIAIFFYTEYSSYLISGIEDGEVSSLLKFYDHLITDQHVNLVLLAAKTGIIHYIDSRMFYVTLYALIQIISFTLGASAGYFYLSRLAFCEKCSRYLSKRSQSERYYYDREMLSETSNTIVDLANEDKFFEAIQEHEQRGDLDEYDNHNYRLKLTIKYCKSCPTNCLSLNGEKSTFKDMWYSIKRHSFNIYTQKQLEI